jgi:hypothetical protein
VFESHRGHGCLSVVSVVRCQVEVSATSWSLVQRSPTDGGVSQMCVIMKPRRNEEAQAHIRLSSHRKKNRFVGQEFQIKRGLYNDTRLLIKEMHENYLKIEILKCVYVGNKVIFPRNDLASSTQQVSSALKRTVSNDTNIRNDYK